MRMIKTTCFAIMLFIAGNVLAQNTKNATAEKKQPSQDERVDRELNKMKEEVSLTSDQAPKVREVLATAVKQHDMDKAAANGDAAKEKELDEKRSKIKRDSLKSILTPDQYKKLEAIWKEHKGGGKAENK